jgi:hypothetical protein
MRRQKSWDKAAAFSAYARQRDNKELEAWVAEIKCRAVVRIGSLSHELETNEPTQLIVHLRLAKNGDPMIGDDPGEHVGGLRFIQVTLPRVRMTLIVALHSGPVRLFTGHGKARCYGSEAAMRRAAVALSPAKPDHILVHKPN